MLINSLYSSTIINYVVAIMFYSLLMPPAPDIMTKREPGLAAYIYAL